MKIYEILTDCGCSIFKSFEDAAYAAREGDYISEYDLNNSKTHQVSRCLLPIKEWVVVDGELRDLDDLNDPFDV